MYYYIKREDIFSSGYWSVLELTKGLGEAWKELGIEKEGSYIVNTIINTTKPF